MSSNAGRQAGWLAIVACLALLLLGRPVRAQLGLEVSSPVPVETNPAAVPREAGAHGVATDGNKWLLVYAPRPPSLPYESFDTKEGSLWGRFVDAQGVAIAPPFQIAETGIVSFRGLSVAFDGASFVVVWVDEVSGGSVSNFAVRYMRVSADGTVTSPPAVLESPDYAAAIAVSAGETGVLVAVGASGACHTWVVTADAVIEGDTVSSPGYCYPQASFSDGVWLVANASPGLDSSTLLAQLAGDGQLVLGTAQSVEPTLYGFSLSVTPAVDGFVVARENGGNLELIRVGFDGNAALDDLVIEGAGRPALVARDDGYALFYSSGANMVQQLTPELELDSPEPFELASGTEFVPAVAASGQEALVTWLGDYNELRAGLFSFGQQPAFGQARVISTATAHQSLPQVAPGSDGWLVAWQEERIADAQPDPQNGIRGVRLDALGQPLGEPITIIHDPVVQDPLLSRQLIEVARGPGGWLVASCDYTHAYVDHVADDLSVSSVALPLSSIKDPSRLHLAGSPAGWLVAWKEDLGIPSIAAARIEPGGSVKDSVVVSTTEYEATTPIRTAYHAGDYIVLWQGDEGDVSTVTLPTTAALPTPVPQKLIDVDGHTYDFDVAFGDQGWWAWTNVDSSRSFRTSGGLVFGLPEGAPFLPLVAVDGLALTGTWLSLTSGLELHLAPPEGNLTKVHSIFGWLRGDLSQAVDNRVLMATEESVWVGSHLTERIRTRLLTVSDGVPSGGAGGVGGAESGEGGESGSSPSAGAGGVGSHEGGSPGQPVGDSGSPNQGDGGGAQPEPSGSGGDGLTPAAGGVAAGGTPEVPEGCGCRTAGKTDDAQHLGACLALLLITLSRRAGSRVASA